MYKIGRSGKHYFLEVEDDRVYDSETLPFIFKAITDMEIDNAYFNNSNQVELDEAGIDELEF